jgi:hypothetical protein
MTVKESSRSICQPLWVQGNAGDNFVRPVEDVLGIANE